MKKVDILLVGVGMLFVVFFARIAFVLLSDPTALNNPDGWAIAFLGLLMDGLVFGLIGLWAGGFLAWLYNLVIDHPEQRDASNLAQFKLRRLPATYVILPLILALFFLGLIIYNSTYLAPRLTWLIVAGTVIGSVWLLFDRWSLTKTRFIVRPNSLSIATSLSSINQMISFVDITAVETFTPLEAERPTACRGDECLIGFANTGFNAPCELLTGFTPAERASLKIRGFALVILSLFGIVVSFHNDYLVGLLGGAAFMLVGIHWLYLAYKKS